MILVVAPTEITGFKGLLLRATLAEGESHEGTSLGNDVVGIKSV